MNGFLRAYSSMVLLFFLFDGIGNLTAQDIIIDHSCTDITVIPESAINQAKASLHIAYGHTSHGSQLTSGMSGLIGFANNNGLGMTYAHDIFEWNNGGQNGALDLEDGDGYGDGWLDHDCGYFPSWVDETRNYLDDPSHSDVNVIIWSWCGQASGRNDQEMIDTYLAPMTQLEEDYPEVTFVYMTGHADGSGESGNLHQRNQQIRNYCINNDKVLFDFYDIECYDPDDNYYGDKGVNDDCSYDGGNWAIEWQNTHTEGVDWYDCGAAHSQPLNANRKAYAAWYLWCRIAGWDPLSGSENLFDKEGKQFMLLQNRPNPVRKTTEISFVLKEKSELKLSVYSLQGKMISCLIDDDYLAGEHAKTLCGDKFSSGIYFILLRTERDHCVKKMIVLK
jgi:hypothetical protein